MISKVAGIPYSELNSKPGGQEAADELGDELIFTAPLQPLAAEQIHMMEAATAQGVDAILISADDDGVVRIDPPRWMWYNSIACDDLDYPLCFLLK